MNAREEILASIRNALEVQASDPAGSHARIAQDYNRIGKLDHEARLEFFIDRLVDYDTEIIQVTAEGELPGAIAEALQHADENHDLPTAEIEGVPAVVTTCEAAVAATGTIILVHEGAQARRVLTLLPDHHICLVRRDQVFELLPETLTALALKATKPITTISGPSATSDIEMTRIRGVHGPRRLTVILYG